MEKQIPDLLLGVTEQLTELAAASRRASARVQILEMLLLNVVTQAGTNTLFDPPMKAAVEITKGEVLRAARARPAEGRSNIDHMMLEVLNEVLENAGLMEPPTGG